MHCLVGTFVKDLAEEYSPDSKTPYYPVKVALSASKSRVFYFKDQAQQEKWSLIIKEVVGYSDLFDHYKLEKTLGKGQFGLVKLAVHKKTG
jgi:hypothetical protein